MDVTHQEIARRLPWYLAGNEDLLENIRGGLAQGIYTSIDEAVRTAKSLYRSLIETQDGLPAIVNSLPARSMEEL